MITYQFSYEADCGKKIFKKMLKQLGIKTKKWNDDTFQASKGQTQLLKFIASCLDDCHVICDTLEEQTKFDGMRIYCDNDMEAYLNNPVQFKKGIYLDMYNIKTED